MQRLLVGRRAGLVDRPPGFCVRQQPQQILDQRAERLGRSFGQFAKRKRPASPAVRLQCFWVDAPGDELSVGSEVDLPAIEQDLRPAPSDRTSNQEKGFRRLAYARRCKPDMLLDQTGDDRRMLLARCIRVDRQATVTADDADAATHIAPSLGVLARRFACQPAFEAGPPNLGADAGDLAERCRIYARSGRERRAGRRYGNKASVAQRPEQAPRVVRGLDIHASTHSVAC